MISTPALALGTAAAVVTLALVGLYERDRISDVDSAILGVVVTVALAVAGLGHDASGVGPVARALGAPAYGAWLTYLAYRTVRWLANP